MKSLGLLDLLTDYCSDIASTDLQGNNPLKTCKSMIEGILCHEKMNKRRNTPDIKKKEPELIKSSSCYPLVTFADIIGCDEAKQSLLENIILPLTLDPQLRNQIFTGIQRFNYII